MSTDHQPAQPPADDGDLIAVPGGVVRFVTTALGRRVSAPTVRRWVESGRLPIRRLLGRQWATAADVLAIIGGVDGRFLRVPAGVQDEVERMTGRRISTETVRLWIERGLQGEFLAVSHRVAGTGFVTVEELHRFARARQRTRRSLFSTWKDGAA